MNAIRWAAKSNVVIEKHASKVEHLSRMLLAGETNRIETNLKALKTAKRLRGIFEPRLCPDPGLAHLVPIGSSVSGLAYKESSDVDFTYAASPAILKDFHSGRTRRMHYVNSLREKIEKLCEEEEDEWTLAEPVILPKPTARIPIITARFKNGYSVDVQFPNETFQAIRNTNLIKQYVSADRRFRTVYHWLHTVFASFGLLNPKEQLLSSYRTALLCVHYLHTREIAPNVLPVVYKDYPELVGKHLPLWRIEQLLDAPHQPRLKGWKSKNTKSVGELAIGLVHYYADFDPYINEIYIGRGQRAIKGFLGKNLQLQIYDPYSGTPTTLSNFLPDLLFTTFAFLRECLAEGRLIESYPYLEEADEFRSRVREKPWSEFLRPAAPAGDFTIAKGSVDGVKTTKEGTCVLEL